MCPSVFEHNAGARQNSSGLSSRRGWSPSEVTSHCQSQAADRFFLSETSIGTFTRTLYYSYTLGFVSLLPRGAEMWDVYMDGINESVRRVRQVRECTWRCLITTFTRLSQPIRSHNRVLLLKVSLSQFVPTLIQFWSLIYCLNQRIMEMLMCLYTS